MASRKIYLCRIILKDKSRGAPFFSCQHHFGKFLFRDFEGGEVRGKGNEMEKITSADNELCEYCTGEHYNEQFDKSRRRAQAMMGLLLGEWGGQTKNDSL